MRTGVSYMGHHNPKHLRTDLADIAALGCNDVLLAAQENDFVYMTGKLDFLPKIARDHGLRPIAIFWGVLNCFGGGRSSQFLLEQPGCQQRKKDGSHHPPGCYNNAKCVARVKQMIDRIAHAGFEGYFIDEPYPLDCYCDACRDLFSQWYRGDLMTADDAVVKAFRNRCIFGYIETLGGYIKQHHPQIETMCCLMPTERAIWAQTAQVPGLDNLGTDIYWVNQDNDVEEMTPMVRDLADVCRQHGKIHHEWLQAWNVRAGKESRIVEQGEILIREQPDALYVWAYESQIGTTETSDDPAAAWSAACEVLRLARQ